MISIVICSRSSDISSELKNNISETIGSEFELVIIDNSRKEFSIFSAYNEGVSRSKGDVLCFCHDDILFRSNNWGTLIQELFTVDSIGVVGIIGTHFLPRAPMYWWSSPFISQYSINNDKGRVKINDTRVFFKGNIADVVAVDGVCFFIPKYLFNAIRFDDIVFGGFHSYDMDICMQVQKLGKRVCVTDVLSVEHFWSNDSIKNKAYRKQLDTNLKLFYQKWKKDLPIVRGIDEPEIVIKRLNNLCVQAYEVERLRMSKEYRLGRLLLKPFGIFK